jgi:uncharacterized protein (DUF1015 family)
VISPEQQQAYHEQSQFNIIHVDYGLDLPGRDKYADAAQKLDEWVADGVLIQDEKPAIYVTEHEFSDMQGRKRLRRGFIALLKVEPFSSGAVLPHEKTFKKHKKDRLDLLRATGAQMNPVFTFFSDPDGKAADILAAAATGAPDSAFDFVDGAHNRMWRLTDPDTIRALQKTIKKQPVFIADGHHRYETMLNFRRETRKNLGGKLPKDHPARWGLVYFCTAEDPGLEVTSPHRVLKNLPDFDPQKMLKKLDKFFSIQKTADNCALEDTSNPDAPHGFAMQIGPELYCLTLRKGVLNKAMPEISRALRELHVTVCSELIVRPLIGDSGKILDHVSYIVDPSEAAAAVQSGACQAAVFLPPFNMNHLMDAVETGQVLPHKSTYFYPKLVTGLAIYRYSV